jgi:galactose mutarotase-like enzyme
MDYPISTTRKGNGPIATIQDGKLTSIAFPGGREFMHDGRVGWGHSEITMFPIVGPAKDYKILIEGQEFSMDQHGIARYMGFNLSAMAKYVKLRQRFSKLGFIKNDKFMEGKDNPRLLAWPYPYSISKTIFPENEESITVRFKIENESLVETMPYMFGWHPAFRTQGKVESGLFYVGKKTHSLEEVMEASQTGALLLEGVRDVTYVNSESGLGVAISTKGFNHTMLWSPHEDMFCIEPVTHLPSPEVTPFSDPSAYEQLKPRECNEYDINIKPVLPQ